MDITSFYRVQLNKNFTFKKLYEIIPYLNDLGISHIYMSPVLKSSKGSLHGYDVVDYSMINPEIGTDDELNKISEELKRLSMGIMIDFVPNHMAMNSENVYLQDIFKKGNDSNFSGLFDIIYNEDTPEGKIVLPVLDKEYYKSLQNDFKLDLKKGVVSINGNDYNLFEGFEYSDNHSKEYSSYINSIIESQIFYPGYWRNYISGTNYRRFFAINSLIGINSEKEKFFDILFYKVNELKDKKIIDAIRLDHIDGLYSPFNFIKKVQNKLNIKIYIEKILTGDEKLPYINDLNGTTGYDFIYYVDYLFINNMTIAKLNDIYNKFTGEFMNPEEMLYKRKKEFIEKYYKSELSYLSNIFLKSFHKNIYGHECTMDGTKKLLTEILANFPFYRIYTSLDLKKEMVKLSKYVAGLKLDTYESNALQKILINPDDYNIYCINRLQQFLPALMAKSMEDNLFFRYIPDLGRNEVGCYIFKDFISIDEFHEYNNYKSKNYNSSINALSTHDTKLGEDIRAKIISLYNDPDNWFNIINKLHEISLKYKHVLKNYEIPSKNEEYYFYQIILAGEPDEWDVNFANRVKSQIIKAIRESEVNSSWNNPSEKYEENVLYYIDKSLNDNNFRLAFKKFSGIHNLNGMLISAMQTVLKITAPGIPDNYQGSELVNNHFTDPDNRGTVDFELLIKELKKVKEIKSIKDIHNIEDFIVSGELKLFINYNLLNFRKKHKDIFAGNYEKLKVSGKFKDDIIAYSRSSEKEAIVVVVSKNTFEYVNDIKSMNLHFYDNTEVIIEQGNKFKNLFTGKTLEIKNRAKIDEIFDGLPFSVLYGECE